MHMHVYTRMWYSICTFTCSASLHTPLHVTRLVTTSYGCSTVAELEHGLSRETHDVKTMPKCYDLTNVLVRDRMFANREDRQLPRDLFYVVCMFMFVFQAASVLLFVQVAYGVIP